MAIVNEVVTVFKFKGNTSQLKKFSLDSGTAIKRAKEFSVAAAASAAALGAFIKITLNGVDAQAQLFKTIGVSIERIQSLGFAASVSGSDAQALESTLSNLSKKIGEASVKGSEDFQRLGLSVRGANGEVKLADQVLVDVGKRFKDLGLSLQEQQTYAEALGIDESLIQLLGKTTKELSAMEKQAKSFGLVTEKQAQDVVKFNDAMTTMKFALTATSRQFAISLAPAMEAAAGVLMDFLSALGNVAQAFDAVIENTIGWKPLLIGLGAALAIAFWPITLAAAAVFALIAIVDDLFVAFQGGNSVIASLFQEFFKIDIVAKLKSDFAEIAGFFDGIAQAIANVIVFFQRLDFSNVFSDLLPAWAVKLLGAGSGSSGAPTSLPAAGGNSSSISNSSNSVSQDIKINIASTDPLTAGMNASSEIKRQMVDAQNQTGRGGR
jgi:hypothetical protein